MGVPRRIWYAIISIILNPQLTLIWRPDLPPFTTPASSSGRSETQRRVELAALQVTFERFAEYTMPPLHRIQLLRSLPQLRQETGDAQISPACLVLFAVRAADGECYLPGMLGLPGDRLHQQRTAGDRLEPVIGSARRTNRLHQLKISATLPASSRHRFRSCVVKPPQPHWFFSSSNEFSQSPRSRYRLAQREDLDVQRRDQRALFHSGRFGLTSAKLSSGCSGLRAIDQHQGTHRGTVVQHEMTLPAPAHQPQHRLLALPAPGLRRGRL